MKKQIVVDLLQKYSKERLDKYREDFLAIKKKMGTYDTHPNFDDLKAGSVVELTNGMGVRLQTELLGFNIDGKAYVMWDCIWFSIDLLKRDYKFICSIEEYNTIMKWWNMVKTQFPYILPSNIDIENVAFENIKEMFDSIQVQFHKK